ncbi:MAG: hypothetical protein ACRC0V_05520 [Fusobacteriaceae bacterium]
MVYDLTREQVKEVLEYYLKVAKKAKGEVVVLNKTSDEADEYVIGKIGDFETIKTQKNDFLEITVYDNMEEDIEYEEFSIGEGKDYNAMKKDILKLSVNEKEIKVKKEEKKTFKKEHPFQKFLKK